VAKRGIDKDNTEQTTDALGNTEQSTFEPDHKARTIVKAIRRFTHEESEPEPELRGKFNLVQ